MTKLSNKGKLMKTKSDKVIKGMVFAGCSFTWGQGLYFYSNLPTLAEPKPHHYDNTLVKETHMAYMRSVRHPRLVANHFNTYEITQPFNGGSHDSILSWWKASFSKDPSWNRESTFTVPKLDYSDISHLVFQCTQPHRCWIMLNDKDNQQYQINFNDVYRPENRDNFTKWLNENNMTDDDFQHYYITQSMDKVKNFLQEVESNGVKTIIFTWPSENVFYIQNDPWLSKRFVTFNYNGTTYNSIQEMMQINKELEILRDSDNFEITPGDHHPSLKCHRVMSDNLIDYIEKMQ